MENKVVVLSDLVAQLAAKTGTSETLCEAFLKELLSYSSENLIDGKSVQIPGIGAFDVVDGDIRFSVDADLNSFLNSAFECFEVIELDDDVPDDIFDEEAIEPVPAPVEANPEPEEKVSEELPEETTAAKVENEILLPPPVPEEDKVKVVMEEPVMESQQEDVATHEEFAPVIATVEPMPAQEKQEIVQTEAYERPDEVGQEEVADYSYDDEEEAPKRRCAPTFLCGFISGVCLAAIIAVVLFYMGKIEVVSTETPVVEDVVAADEVTDSLSTQVEKEVADSVEMESEPDPVAEADQPVAEKKAETSAVTCKVTKTTYLCSMSRKYYGHYAFWVYIYLENKSVIKDPNNIAIGTTLVIPPAEKYGIDKNDPASIAKADALAAEILAKI